jgi:hypothetical protein
MLAPNQLAILRYINPSMTHSEKILAQEDIGHAQPRLSQSIASWDSSPNSTSYQSQGSTALGKSTTTTFIEAGTFFSFKNNKDLLQMV